MVPAWSLWSAHSPHVVQQPQLSRCQRNKTLWHFAASAAPRATISHLQIVPGVLQESPPAQAGAASPLETAPVAAAPAVLAAAVLAAAEPGAHTDASGCASSPGWKLPDARCLRSGGCWGPSAGPGDHRATRPARLSRSQHQHSPRPQQSHSKVLEITGSWVRRGKPCCLP